MKRIGILTGGGDCPGLNAAIRAAVRKGMSEGYEFIGIKDGWKGLINKESMPLDLEVISGILSKGGTILGTSRTNPFKVEEGVEKCKSNYKKLELEALIAIGGEDTLGVANKLVKEGLNIVGVPKTIDNDLSATDYTFGFDTAINISMEAMDRLRTTAESHHRVLVIEIMGRHAGWIALFSGIAGGANIILIPELAIDIEEVCATLKKRCERGRNFSIVAVAEGAKLEEGDSVLQVEKLDAFGHVRLGGIGEVLAKLIESKTKLETRSVVLGHLQRGGSPTAFDRILGTRFGLKVIDLIKEKKFGHMVSLKGIDIVVVPLERAVEKLKTVDLELYNSIKVLFG